MGKKTTPGMVAVSTLKSNKENPRHLTKQGLATIKKSISSFEKMMSLRPMIIDNDNIVIGGNQRLRAIKSLGMKHIPESWVKKAGDLTVTERKEFIAKDNIAIGEWDWDILANEWDSQLLQEWGLNIPGLNDEKETVTEDDYQPPKEIKTDIKRGDLFQIGEHRLLCGDSTINSEVQKLMQESKANLLMTSPPYWVGKKYEFEKEEKQINEFVTRTVVCSMIAMSKDNSRIVINSGTAMGTAMGEKKTRVILLIDKWINNFQDADWMLRSIRHWVKGGGGAGIPISAKADYVYPCMEYLLTFYNVKGKNRGQNKLNEQWCQQSNWNDIKGDRQENKAGFPIELPARFIKLYSLQGEIVYEPFIGNGTTMVACEKLQRKCYSIDKEPQSCQITIDRMQALDPTLTVIKNGKKYKRCAK